MALRIARCPRCETLMSGRARKAPVSCSACGHILEGGYRLGARFRWDWWVLGGLAGGILADLLLLHSGYGRHSPAADFVLLMMPYAGVLAGSFLRTLVRRRSRLQC